MKNYPARDSRDKDGVPGMWPMFGYVSNMVDLALLYDDPEGFVRFMREAGLDRTSRTFDGLSMERYCDKREAVKCKAALKNLAPL